MLPVILTASQQRRPPRCWGMLWCIRCFPQSKQLDCDITPRLPTVRFSSFIETISISVFSFRVSCSGAWIPMLQPTMHQTHIASVLSPLFWLTINSSVSLLWMMGNLKLVDGVYFSFVINVIYQCFVNILFLYT